MLRLRIIHQLRTATFLLVLFVILGALGTLIWANVTGMPEAWRQAVERAIAERGIHVKIGHLSYNPLEGIVAREVEVYASKERKQVLSRLEGIILDLDNSKLAKGEIQLARVKLDKARLTLAVDPDDPNSEILRVDNIHGEFIPPGNPHIEVRNARGTIAGIDVILNAKIADDLGSRSEHIESRGQENQSELIAKILRELRAWKFDQDNSPQVRIQLVGKRSEMDQARAKISLQAKAIGKNQHIIEHVAAEAELQRNLLSVTSFQATNGNRRLSARLDYDMNRQSGRFSIQSSLEIPELLQSWFGAKPIKDLVIAGNQSLDADGEFIIKRGKAVDIHATGYAHCNSAMLCGIRFDSIKSSFAWRNGDLYLKDVLMTRPDGKVSGKVLIDGQIVRLDLHSSLLAEFYRPLFTDKHVEEIIDNFETHPQSRMELSLEGGFDRADPESWAYAGKVSLRDISYRGVALQSLETDLSVSSLRMDFTNGHITFDYSDYLMAKRFNGARVGQLSFDSVRYQAHDHQSLTFDGLDGSFWPAPLCRMFLNETSEELEKYAFYQPPRISGSGIIGLDNNEDTVISVNFSSTHQAEYVLLGSPVTIDQPSGKVTVTDTGVTITDLKLGVFDGPLEADFNFPRGKPMEAKIQAAELSMDSINSTYGFNVESEGRISLSLDFQMQPARIASMQGQGNFKLEKAELFSVPIFGPLSIVMQGVLGDKRIGAERAKNASCDFRIKDGVMASDSFVTTTKSLVFTGEGWVDLDKKSMDMTMRVNARGLLGLVTFPFRPFYGLFQFQGTGPLDKPVWNQVAFTKPHDKVQDILLKEPGEKTGQP